MKKIFLMLIMMSVTSISYSQTLDYSNYHICLQDSFKTYASPTGTFPTSDFSNNTTSPYWAPFHNVWTTEKGDYTTTTLFKGSSVSMPSYGVIQLTETQLGSAFDTINGDGSLRTVDHYSGALTTNQYFGYGIMEASMRISNDTHGGSDIASSAFWSNICCGTSATEIDVIDASENNYLIHRLWDWSYSPRHLISFAEGYSIDLSTAFHLYSCVWTPKTISYYLDGNFIRSIDYTALRSYETFQTFSICLNAFTATVSGTSMYVNSFKIWRQNCENDPIDIAISPIGPTITPALYKSGAIINSNTCFKVPGSALLLEAEATTITANFLADESSPMSSSYADDDGTESHVSNGFLEIIPLKCSDDNSGEDIWFRKSNTNDPNHYNTPNFNSSYSTTSRDIFTTNNAHLSANTFATDPAQIQVFPNPAQNTINILYPCNASGQMSIVIQDISGRTLYKEAVDCNEGGAVQQSVDISSFVQGVYTVNLTMNDQHVVKKFVKL